MGRITLGIVGLVCITSIASAADLPVKAPPPAPMAPPYSWTGFYVGGDVGAIRNRSSGEWDPLPNRDFFGELSIAGDLKKTAFIGGLHAGYNWQFAPTWVVGIEGDMSWTDAKGEFTMPWTRLIGGAAGANRPDAHTSMSIGPDWIATVRGRIGYLVVSNALRISPGGARVGQCSI